MRVQGEWLPYADVVTPGGHVSVYVSEDPQHEPRDDLDSVGAIQNYGALIAGANLKCNAVVVTRAAAKRLAADYAKWHRAMYGAPEAKH